MVLVSNSYARFYKGISASGKGRLCVSDITYHKKEDFLKSKESVSIEIKPDITEVEKGFFDIFITLKQLVIAKSVKQIDVSQETLDLFHTNNVVIRGYFDTYADNFAKKYGLPFMHSDMVIARVGDYFSPAGIDIITLCFTPNGKPFIHQNCLCQGSSAGSSGGGENSFDLPADFYRRYTTEKIAAECRGTCYDDICNNADLKSFLEIAKARKGFCRGSK